MALSAVRRDICVAVRLSPAALSHEINRRRQQIASRDLILKPQSFQQATALAAAQMFTSSREAEF